jgi:hypothetical protein
VLGFVTSLRHPHNMKSIRRVARLLDGMLASVCRQEDPDICVVVVHNGLPDLTVRDPRVTFVDVDFAAPNPRGQVRIAYRDRMLDKGAKLTVGATRARDLGASHIMFFDYDDRAHHRLSAHANSDDTAAGWFSPTGYIHTRGLRWVTFVDHDFHKKCGSTSIVRTDLLGLPQTLDPSPSLEDVSARCGDDYLVGFVGEHSRRPELIEPRGGHLEPLPFPSAIWEIGSGENISGSLIAGGARLPIGAPLTEQYGLARPGAMQVAASQFATSLRRATRVVRPWND